MKQVKNDPITLLEGKPVDTDYETIIEKEDFPPYWKMKLMSNSLCYETFSKQDYESENDAKIKIRKTGFVDCSLFIKKENIVQIASNYFNSDNKDKDYLAITIESKYTNEIIKLTYNIKSEIKDFKKDLKALKDWWLSE